MSWLDDKFTCVIWVIGVKMKMPCIGVVNKWKKCYSVGGASRKKTVLPFMSVGRISKGGLGGSGRNKEKMSRCNLKGARS